ncbi:MAG TPA: hypothetical protein VL551_16365 [Actinospica sp.]|jgi:hypothetical protein|nr:hypothetical protein [Actinospica sp.]
MATIPLARVRAGATSSATLVTVLVTAGLGNQALQSWREARAGSDGLSGWTGVLFQPLLLTGWRFNEPSGPNSLDHYLAPLVFNVVFVLGTALLVAWATRGSGRLATLFTTWGMVTLAGGLAAAACTPLAFAGIAGQAAKAFQDTVPQGLSLGLIVGALAGVVAAVFGGGGTASSSAAEPALSPLETTATLPMGTNWPLGSDD